MHFTEGIPPIDDIFQSDDSYHSNTRIRPTTLEGIQQRYSSLSMEEITMIYEVSGHSYMKEQ